MDILPSYVVANLEDLIEADAGDLPIRNKSLPIDFPLDFADKRDIAILMTKFTKQPFYKGLAAPQLGILKRIIVFTMPKEECNDRCRTKVWINPSYETVNDKMVEDFECCVSVKSVTGPVKRHEIIHYKANDVKGNIIEGEARGLTARIIQHEIDHLDGKLFIDFVLQDKIISVREYMQKIKSEHSNPTC